MAAEFILDQLEPAAEVPDVEDLLAVVAAARAEADQIRAQARAEGLAQGRAEGEAAARAEAEAVLQPALQALAAASDALAADRAELAERVEHQAVELALELAGKVVAGAIEARPERVVDVVRGALRCLVERERVQVLVHPEDLAVVRESMDRLRGELGGIEHVEVQEERRLERGGAIVRTPAAEIDADLRTKLDRAREAIVAELRETA
jgi:flagellar biosynthesis/type III secretory pathway protein FliH